MNADAGLLIFDGDCGFCTSSANWVARSWPPGPTAVPWQHLGDDELTGLGLSTEQVREAAWWIDGSGRPFRGHRAMARCLSAGRGWKHVLGVLMEHPPLSWAGAAVYPVVVRYRHRLPGGTPACRVAPGHDRRLT